jgi:hypothetical protein
MTREPKVPRMTRDHIILIDFFSVLVSPDSGFLYPSANKYKDLKIQQKNQLIFIFIYLVLMFNKPRSS